MIEIYEGTTKMQTINKVMTASLRETLEGEFTLSFTVLAKSALTLKTGQLAKLDGQYFEIVQITKSIQNGLPICFAGCEHSSYILNSDIYNIDSFDFTGTPSAGLAQVLAGTPFTAGVVEFTNSCTMKINTEVTRRAALMQFIAILGGEIEYDGYNINIRTHRGVTSYRTVMDSRNVTNVSVSYDSRQDTISYDISFLKLLSFMVGDNVQITFTPLGINVQTRIISLEYNPFYRYNIRVEVGKYKPSISDTFYRIESSMGTMEQSVGNIENRLDNLDISYAVVSSLTIGDGTINVTYEVENGSITQYGATYSYTTDTIGRITSINLVDAFSELLLKEVETLAVTVGSFSITYVDGTSASFNYTTDSIGRITAISKA